MNQNIIHAWNNWVNEKEKLKVEYLQKVVGKKRWGICIYCMLSACLVVHSKWMKIKLPEKHLMMITMDRKK